MILPESFDEPLHLLGFALDTYVVLKFPERLVQLHALEVHFIHHTAVPARGQTERETFCYVLQGSAGVESIVEDISVFIKEDITRDYLFSFIKFTIAVALMLWNTRFFFCLLWNVHMVNDPLLQYIYTQFNHLDFSSGFI